ncbi:MAG: hypothetical protein TE42_06695 [Candidatus Synechococcus spongiarum SP3]|uniref:Uncharacterized protein n=1 Tax=Candidatus Synechococcus spongiarum SP3 TaxID=1604020 RepID=A0A0G2IW31_9SYNE|nr:MAG: hypothetical protein TE42_06695 [Candidatus Synechococcus spongiarum SP3]
MQHYKKISVSGHQTACVAFKCCLKKLVVLLITATLYGTRYGYLFRNGNNIFEIETSIFLADVIVELLFHGSYAQLVECFIGKQQFAINGFHNISHFPWWTFQSQAALISTVASRMKRSTFIDQKRIQLGLCQPVCARFDSQWIHCVSPGGAILLVKVVQAMSAGCPVAPSPTHHPIG